MFYTHTLCSNTEAFIFINALSVVVFLLKYCQFKSSFCGAVVAARRWPRRALLFPSNQTESSLGARWHPFATRHISSQTLLDQSTDQPKSNEQPHGIHSLVQYRLAGEALFRLFLYFGSWLQCIIACIQNQRHESALVLFALACKCVYLFGNYIRCFQRFHGARVCVVSAN